MIKLIIGCQLINILRYRACNFAFVVFSFFMKAIRKCNDKFKYSEPFNNLFTQGMVCHETYKDMNGNWLYPDEIKITSERKAIKISDKSEVKIGPSESCLSLKKYC